MKRLTISGGGITFYESVYAKCSNKNAPEIQKQINKNIPFYDMIGYKYEDMTIRKVKDIYNKLGELEDVLEKYGIERAKELEHKLAVKDKALELACKYNFFDNRKRIFFNDSNTEIDNWEDLLKFAINVAEKMVKE